MDCIFQRTKETSMDYKTEELIKLRLILRKLVKETDQEITDYFKQRLLRVIHEIEIEKQEREIK